MLKFSLLRKEQFYMYVVTKIMYTCTYEHTFTIKDLFSSTTNIFFIRITNTDRSIICSIFYLTFFTSNCNVCTQSIVHKLLCTISVQRTSFQIYSVFQKVLKLVQNVTRNIWSPNEIEILPAFWTVKMTHLGVCRYITCKCCARKEEKKEEIYKINHLCIIIKATKNFRK